MKYVIPVLLFSLPNGRQEWKYYNIEDSETDLMEIVHTIGNHGCRITAETLRNGGYSLCIEEPDLGDFKCQLCGPSELEFNTAMQKLLKSFTTSNFNVWKKQMER